MQEKVACSAFIGYNAKVQRATYAFSIRQIFLDDRLPGGFPKHELYPKWQKLQAKYHKKMKDEKLSREKVMYVTPVKKFNRHGYKSQDLVLIATSQTLYL